MKKTYLKPERTITITSFNRHILNNGSPEPQVGINSNRSVSASGVESRQAFDFYDDEDYE